MERGNEENLSRSIQWQAILLSMFGGFTTKNAVVEKVQKAFAPDLYLLSNFVNSDLSFLNEHRYRFNYGTSQRV